MSGFLDAVIADRHKRLAEAFGDISLAELEARAAGTPPARDFAAALRDRADIAIIAEVKKASPSVGPIAPDVDVVAQARAYESGGASAVSVLAEPHWFGGSFDDVGAVASAIALPVLCKDFVVDPIQPLVARSLGASAILLMVSVLGEQVREYLGLVRSVGLEALVEVHDERELDIALTAGATTIGVNSRDLRTLEVAPERVAPVIALARSAGVTVVAESGVRERAGIETAALRGAHAALVGETLMRASDPSAAVRELTGVGRAAG